MKKRILWLGLSFLLVAALVLASCGETVPGEQEEEEGPVWTPGEPQYGGTLTWFTASQQPWLPQSWDNDDLYWLTAVYTEPYLDTLLESDMLDWLGISAVNPWLLMGAAGIASPAFS